MAWNEVGAISQSHTEGWRQIQFPCLDALTRAAPTQGST